MATLKEIAELTSLSSSTISRILNNDSTLSVKEETRKKVFEVAEKLQYQVQKKKNVALDIKIGIITSYDEITEINDPYYLAIRYGAEEYCKTNNYSYEFFYNFPLEKILKSVSGVIAIGHFSEEKIAEIEKITKNIVFVDSTPSSKHDSVNVDLREISELIIKYFVKCGYTKIGYIGGRDAPTIVDDREKTFLEFAKLNEVISENNVYIGEFSSIDGYKMGRLMLEKNELPDALFIANDTIAIGVLKALNEGGIRIPSDIAIISINDIPSSTFTYPALSTIKIYSEMMGAESIKLLVDKIIEERELPLKIFTPFSLKLRETTLKV